MKAVTGTIIAVMLGLAMFLPLQAAAAPVTLPPLVYEYNLKGPTTVLSETITTLGTIKTISASCDFEGEVRLYVSADNGVTYNRITNGQILREGFIPGNQLCFKAEIKQGSILKKLILGFSDSTGLIRIFSDDNISAFKYHKEFYVTGASGELFNYPLKIVLGDEVVPPVYFTAVDQTPLYYYVEKHGDGSLKRTVPYVLEAFVKIPEIPKEGIAIYLYYGNVSRHSEPRRGEESKKRDPSALRPQDDIGNPEKVFSFYDDFSGANLDENKWLVQPGLKKEYEVKDGYLRLKDAGITAREFKMPLGILEFKARLEKNSALQGLLGVFTVYSSGYPGAEHTIAVNNVAKLNIGKPAQPLTDYIYKALLEPDGLVFERYAESGEKQAEIKFLNIGVGSPLKDCGDDKNCHSRESGNPGEGYVGIKADAAYFGGGSAYFDWVRVRPLEEAGVKAVEVKK